MSVARIHSPSLDGGATTILDGIISKRSITIPSGEFATPFWLRPDGDNNRVIKVTSLPWYGTIRVGSLEVLSSDPNAGSAAWSRGPGANQPSGHTQLYQLITTENDQLDVVTPTQPSGQSTSTNRDTINAEGDATDVFEGSGWSDGQHALFNTTDPLGEAPDPILAVKWLDGEVFEGYSALWAPRNWGEWEELYVRQMVFFPDTFTDLPAGVLKLGKWKTLSPIENSFSSNASESFTDVDGHMNFAQLFNPNQVDSNCLIARFKSNDDTLYISGQWVEREMIVQRDTAGNCDGKMRMWHDGVETTGWTDQSGNGNTQDTLTMFDSLPRAWTGQETGFYAGGSSGITLSSDRTFYCGEWFVSGKHTPLTSL